MDKLSIEEKAQRYDEAIERAKNTIEVNQTIPDIVECVESLFPELAESEDERIRKEIIAFLTYYHTGQGNSVKYDDGWIAWLEKQGHDGKKWIYEDVYLKEKEQLIQDGIDEVLENPQKYGLEKQGEY